MEVRVFNYPWSGKLGMIADRCIYCGTAGPAFQVSSAGSRCLNCSSEDTPIPELLKEVEQKGERLAREWCQKHGYDYDQVIETYAEKYGDIWQENPKRIQKPGEDFPE
jgi:hypothetical protein